MLKYLEDVKNKEEYKYLAQLNLLDSFLQLVAYSPLPEHVCSHTRVFVHTRSNSQTEDRRGLQAHHWGLRGSLPFASVDLSA